MAAHIAVGRIGEVYNKDLKNTTYQICGCQDEQWEMMSTRKDKSIAAYIQELNQHIRRYENQMCANMIDTKKVTTRNMDLEEERWKIQVCVPRRTSTPTTEPIEFSFDAPTWSLGKIMATHITIGRIREVYNNDL